MALRKPAGPYAEEEAYKDLRRYSELKNTVKQLRNSVNRARKLWNNKKRDLRMANLRGATGAKWQRMVDNARETLDDAISRRDHAVNSFNGVVNAIKERNRVLLLGERDINVLNQLIDNENYNGEIQVAPTEKGEEVYLKLIDMGMEPTVAD